MYMPCSPYIRMQHAMPVLECKPLVLLGEAGSPQSGLASRRACWVCRKTSMTAVLQSQPINPA